MWFFVDAETDGLYGRFLSVAAMVTDETGKELDRFYGAVSVTREELTSDWVKENVYPYLAQAEKVYANQQDLLEDFWQFWMTYRDKAPCVAYVPCPVEARLFCACVEADPTRREFLAPLPLYDLATLLRSRGMDFDQDLAALSGQTLQRHDALADVRMMAAIWVKLL